MMIRILKELAGVGFHYSPGDKAELPDAEAIAWISCGLARAVEIETAALEPPERTVARRRRTNG
jgi:hypothetical protein